MSNQRNVSPSCRVCRRRLGSGAVRYQMTRRAPLDGSPVRLWWLCDRCICEVESACDTTRDLYFGPGETLKKVGAFSG